YDQTFPIIHIPAAALSYPYTTLFRSSQTNLVAAGGPPTMANVGFTAAFASGSHSILVSVTDTKQCAATCSTTVTILSTNGAPMADRKSKRLNYSHQNISYYVFCLTNK